MNRRQMNATRRRYLYTHAYGAMLASLTIIAALAFFADPSALERSAIGQAFHPYDYGWNVLYLLGGIGMLVGLADLRPRIELAGISLLAAAITINMLALLSIRPSSYAALATFTAVVLALLARARVIVSGEPGQTIVVKDRTAAE